jgi:ABC-type Zn uptake system ZnuABC Zn-binding protein ZnuA
LRKITVILALIWANLGRAQGDVISSFTIIDYWTGRLIPESISHKSLIPSGGELHGYQMSPADLRLLNGSKLAVGLNPLAEPWLADWAKANHREADVLWLNPNPSRQLLHAWLNPEAAKAMVIQLNTELSTRFKIPKKESQVSINKLLKEIDETAVVLKKLFASTPEARRKMVTYHPSLESFADYFKIEVVATIVESSIAESADPSVQRYSEILKRIKKENVRLVACDEGQNRRIAEQLTTDSQLPSPISLSFEYLQPPGNLGDTWPTMMIMNAQKIADGLQK